MQANFDTVSDLNPRQAIWIDRDCGPGCVDLGRVEPEYGAQPKSNN